MNTHQTAESPYERVLRTGREQGIEQGIEQGKVNHRDSLIQLACDFGASTELVAEWRATKLDEAISLISDWLRNSRNS